MLNNASKEYLYPILKNMQALQTLKFTNAHMGINDAKATGHVLADFKNIKELDVRNCNLTLQLVKEIADGLMRAK